MTVQEQVYRFLDEHVGTYFTIRGIADGLYESGETLDDARVMRAIRILLASGRVVHVRGLGYAANKKSCRVETQQPAQTPSNHHERQ